MSSIRTNTIGKAQSLFSGVKSKFTNLWNATKEIFSNLRNWMSNIWNSIKDNTVGIAAVYGVRHVEFLQICVTAYKVLSAKLKVISAVW